MDNDRPHHVTDYSQITPYLYIGSDLCKGWTCLEHSEEFTKLGISTEINLVIERQETIAPHLTAFLQIPTIDHEAPTITQLHMAADFINQTIRIQKICYVHCKNGHGRSPTAAAAYFIKYEHVSASEAIHLIKEKRPEIHLYESQKSILIEFERSIIKI